MSYLLSFVDYGLGRKQELKLRNYLGRGDTNGRGKGAEESNGDVKVHDKIYVGAS